MANSERIIGLESDGSVPVTIVSGGGTGGTASTFGAAFPPTGTAAGFIDDSGDMAGANLDASGNLLVNVAAGSTGNAAASATGAAVPASADYQGLNVGGTLRGHTGVNPTGSVFAAQVDLASLNGTALTTTVPISGTVVVSSVTATSTVNLAQINTHTILEGGVNGAQSVAGALAHDAAGAAEFPVGVGGFASAAAPLNVSADGDLVKAWFFRDGSQATALVAAGALIGGDATNGLDVDVTRVTGTVSVAGTGSAGTAAAGVVTVQGIASMTPVQVSQATAANLNATVIGAGSAGTANAGVVTVQGIASMTPVQVSQATASNLNAQAVGNIAHDSVDSGNPVKVGSVAITTLPTAVAAADRTNQISDVYGRPFVRHGAQGPATGYSHSQHAPAANTKATITRSTAGSGVRIVCTALTVSLAAGASAPAAIQVSVALIDGSSGGTTYLWGPNVISLPAVAGATTAFVLGQCWKPGTANTAMTLEFSAAGGANTIESVEFDSTTVAE